MLWLFFSLSGREGIAAREAWQWGLVKIPQFYTAETAVQANVTRRPAPRDLFPPARPLLKLP